jgi:hypothetical protein
MEKRMIKKGIKHFGGNLDSVERLRLTKKDHNKTRGSTRKHMKS